MYFPFYAPFKLQSQLRHKKHDKQIPDVDFSSIVIEFLKNT